MFRCQSCGNNAPAGSRSTLIIAERTVHQHPYRSHAHKYKLENGRTEYGPDNGGEGYQTKRELRVCPTCAERLKALKEAENAAQAQ